MLNLQFVGSDREIVTAAQQYVKRGGDPSWCFFHVLTKYARDALDRHLVQTRDPLAFEPGTQETRFYQLCDRWLTERTC